MLETLNNYSYKVRAKNRLASMPEMIRIGITGSYGKTTAKVMLAKMLEKKYRVVENMSQKPQTYTESEIDNESHGV